MRAVCGQNVVRWAIDHLLRSTLAMLAHSYGRQCYLPPARLPVQALLPCGPLKSASVRGRSRARRQLITTKARRMLA